MSIDFNPNTSITVNEDWEITFSHGLDSNYLVHGKAIQLLVDHIKYLEILIEECPGNKNVK